MANEIRTRTNFVAGLVEDNPLASGATLLTSAGLANLPVIDTTNHAAIILDPDAVAGNPEIVYVTAHTAAATTATILRAQEGTTARQHERDTPWVHTATSLDFSQPAPPNCKVYRAAAFSTAGGGAFDVVTWDTEAFDTHGMHDLVTDPSRITIPVGWSGKWLFMAGTGYSPDATGTRHTIFRLNGVDAGGAKLDASSSGSTSFIISNMYNLVAGDYMEVFVSKSAAGSLAMNVGDNACWITALFVGAN